MQSRIFHKFVRLDQGEASGASGLGLAINKEIIRARPGQYFHIHSASSRQVKRSLEQKWEHHVFSLWMMNATSG
jgi:signal transduction histidine kinase